MKNQYLMSSVFLTRRCPMHCAYCSLRDSKLVDKELTVKQWATAFEELDKVGCSFHLILGNEPLLLKGLVDLVWWMRGRTPYAIYTSGYPLLIDKHLPALVEAGLPNLSGGCDKLITDRSPETDIERKSNYVFNALKRARGLGVTDLQGTITLSKLNLDSVVDTITSLHEAGIWSGFNIIHYNTDGQFDFFPEKEAIKDLLFTEEDRPKLREVMGQIVSMIKSGDYMIHPPAEYFQGIPDQGVDLSWHCTHPLVLSVDSDGKMRCCGYRRGTRSPNYSALKLSKCYEAFLADNAQDRKECPGCYWSCYWMAEYYFVKDPDFGIKVFQSHEIRRNDE